MIHRGSPTVANPSAPHRHACHALAVPRFAAGPLRALGLAVAAALAGCSSIPGLDDPTITVQPEMFLPKVKGEARMQSASGGALVENPSIGIRDFGLTQRDEEFGGRLFLWDGFTGLEVAYMRFDMTTSNKGQITADFGELRRDDQVRTSLVMDEIRLRYVAEVFGHRFENRDLHVQLGAGGMLAHREMKFEAREEGGSRSQAMRPSDDGVVLAAARLRATWGDVIADVDFAYSDDWTFGGDFTGTLTDLELRLAYHFEDQDLTVFGGYRRQDLPASGHEGEFRYDMDLTLDGYLIGLQVRF